MTVGGGVKGAGAGGHNSITNILTYFHKEKQKDGRLITWVCHCATGKIEQADEKS